MKRTNLALAIVVAAAIAAAMASRGPTDSTDRMSEKAPPMASVDGLLGAESTHAPLDESTSDSGSRPETEIVMGIPVLKDRNCTVTRRYVEVAAGVVTEAYSCVPHETPVGEYEHYSDQELEVLAYSDARAASALGKRLLGEDLEQSRAFLLRAVALQPENVEPVMWLASQAYSLRDDSKAARIAMANAYVITNTARALGSGAHVGWIVDDLRAAGFSDEGFAFLNQSVQDDLRTIREIQLEVFGQSTVQEEWL